MTLVFVSELGYGVVKTPGCRRGVELTAQNTSTNKRSSARLVLNVVIEVTWTKPHASGHISSGVKDMDEISGLARPKR